ncbi:MAG: hypothetical protein JXR89_13235 [Deltaproteobacteria bacterium]|nr:hypothetical protein [Deltaproteobacteria bacterium]
MFLGKFSVRRHWLAVLPGLLLGAVLLVPLFPQEGWRRSLTDGFAEGLQQPCRLESVRFALLPRPAILAHGLSTAASNGFNLRINSLRFYFSFTSLLALAPRFSEIRIENGTAEVPWATLRGAESGAGSDPDAVVERVAELFSASDLSFGPDPLRLSWRDLIFRLPDIPGFSSPLTLSDCAGGWNLRPGNQSVELDATAALLGGRGSFKLMRYRLGEATQPPDISQSAEGNEHLEVSCRLRKLTLPKGVNLGLRFREDSTQTWLWRADFSEADLDLDLSGDPRAGMRFNGRCSAAEHQVFAPAATDPGEICSRGSFKAGFAGFFQRREGYLNLKNASFAYPGAAVFFTRGLIRFREPFFVDLVSNFRVESLAQVLARVPCCSPAPYSLEGALAGEGKLVGNPFEIPVLKLEVSSEALTLLRFEEPSPKEVSTISPVASGAKNSEQDPDRMDVVAAAPFSGRDYLTAAAALLEQAAGWRWFLDGNCNIKRLHISGHDFSEFNLVGRKDLTQLEIERLVARCDAQGELRISLLLDELLHEPRWRTSLVCKNIEVDKFLADSPLSGTLDAAMVGGGRLPLRGVIDENLDLNGKWQLRRGRIAAVPLWLAGNRFLEDSGLRVLKNEFSSCSGGFSVRKQVWSLNDVKISGAGPELQARGRYYSFSRKLDFRGMVAAERPRSFSLAGRPEAPLFYLDD